MHREPSQGSDGFVPESSPASMAKDLVVEEYFPLGEPEGPTKACGAWQSDRRTTWKERLYKLLGGFWCNMLGHKRVEVLAINSIQLNSIPNLSTRKHPQGSIHNESNSHHGPKFAQSPEDFADPGMAAWVQLDGVWSQGTQHPAVSAWRRGTEPSWQDISGGITLGCILVAQSLAHADLCKVHPGPMYHATQKCLLYFSLFFICVRSIPQTDVKWIWGASRSVALFLTVSTMLSQIMHSDSELPRVAPSILLASL